MKLKIPCKSIYEIKNNINLQTNIKICQANYRSCCDPKIFKRSVIYHEEQNSNPYRIW